MLQRAGRTSARSGDCPVQSAEGCIAVDETGAACDVYRCLFHAGRAGRFFQVAAARFQICMVDLVECVSRHLTAFRHSLIEL